MVQGFLEKTNQAWKYKLVDRWLLWLGLAMIGLGLILKDASLSGASILTGLVVAGGGHLFAVLGIRCPKCRTRLYLKGMREQKPGAFDSWLMSLPQCPACGSDGNLHDGL